MLPNSPNRLNDCALLNCRPRRCIESQLDDEHRASGQRRVSPLISAKERTWISKCSSPGRPGQKISTHLCVSSFVTGSIGQTPALDANLSTMSCIASSSKHVLQSPLAAISVAGRRWASTQAADRSDDRSDGNQGESMPPLPTDVYRTTHLTAPSRSRQTSGRPSNSVESHAPTPRRTCIEP